MRLTKKKGGYWTKFECAGCGRTESYHVATLYEISSTCQGCGKRIEGRVLSAVDGRTWLDADGIVEELQLAGCGYVDGYDCEWDDYKDWP